MGVQSADICLRSGGLLSSTVGSDLVSPGRTPRAVKQVLKRAGVVTEHRALADPNPTAALHEDDVARGERLNPFIDGLAAVVDTEVGAGGLKRLNQFVSPRFEFPSRNRRAHRRGHDSGGQDFVQPSDRVSNLVRERHDVASGLGVVAIE